MADNILKDVSAKVGDQAKFSAEVAGEAVGEWFIGDRKIDGDDKIAIGKEGQVQWLQFNAVEESNFAETVALVVDGKRNEAKLLKTEEAAPEPPKEEPKPEPPKEEAKPEPPKEEPKPEPPKEEPKKEEVKKEEPKTAKPEFDAQGRKIAYDENGEVIDIDLDAPETHKAAVKIQSVFRGHLRRKMMKMKMMSQGLLAAVKLRKINSNEVRKPQPSIKEKPAHIKSKWFKDPNTNYWVQLEVKTEETWGKIGEFSKKTIFD